MKCTIRLTLGDDEGRATHIWEDNITLLTMLRAILALRRFQNPHLKEMTRLIMEKTRCPSTEED